MSTRHAHPGTSAEHTWPRQADPSAAAPTPTADPIDFPRALGQRRASRRLSQLELALRAGTTRRHVSFMESGRSAPGRGMVVRLAESLELPLWERNNLLLTAHRSVD
jgi:hypothetical protein